jgi:hypothetical protein
MALRIAAAADAAPPEDMKQVLAAVKELRSIVDQITRPTMPMPISSGGGKNVPGDDSPGGPFGAVRAEVVDASAV